LAALTISIALVILRVEFIERILLFISSELAICFINPKSKILMSNKVQNPNDKFLKFELGILLEI
jgi:hypothetical protein